MDIIYLNLINKLLSLKNDKVKLISIAPFIVEINGNEFVIEKGMSIYQNKEFYKVENELTKAIEEKLKN